MSSKTTNVCHLPQLSSNSGSGETNFSHCQQLKSLIKSKTKLINNTLQLSKISEQLLDIANNPKKSLSKLYRVISSSNPTITLPKARWECDLVLSPDQDLWRQICRDFFFMTTNTNLQLTTQYHAIHRTHVTIMFIVGLTDTGTCSQCTLGSTDTYFHATWFYQPVHSLWTIITETLSTVLDCRVPLSPTLCLLRDTSDILFAPKNTIPVLLSLAIAMKIVFQNWKS